MLLINKLTKPGGIKRVELHPDTVQIVLSDGTELIYKGNKTRYVEQDCDCPDTTPDVRRD